MKTLYEYAVTNKFFTKDEEAFNEDLKVAKFFESLRTQYIASLALDREAIPSITNWYAEPTTSLSTGETGYSNETPFLAPDTEFFKICEERISSVDKDGVTLINAIWEELDKDLSVLAGFEVISKKVSALINTPFDPYTNADGTPNEELVDRLQDLGNLIKFMFGSANDPSAEAMFVHVHTIGKTLAGMQDGIHMHNPLLAEATSVMELLNDKEHVHLIQGGLFGVLLKTVTNYVADPKNADDTETLLKVKEALELPPLNCVNLLIDITGDVEELRGINAQVRNAHNDFEEIAKRNDAWLPMFFPNGIV